MKTNTTPSINDDLKKQTDAFVLIRPIYTLLGTKIQDIILENFELKSISPHAVTHRIKSEKSFKGKVELKQYNDAVNQMTDLLGVRVIAYVEDDVDEICDLLRDLFEIDESNSVNKNDELGFDRVGYKSVHLVCSLKEDRSNLPEYARFKGLAFEVQVRTILQHTWAEIEHDKNYKFAGVLPIEIKRRLMLLAGTLELVDREFNQISKEIDSYSGEVKEQALEGKLDILINSLSLQEYLNNKFSILIESGKALPDFNGRDSEIIEELKSFGIESLKDLDVIIPNDFQDVIEAHLAIESNFLGLLRHVMIVHDLDKYLDKSYKKNWIYADVNSGDLIHYGVNVEKLDKETTKYSKTKPK